MKKGKINEDRIQKKNTIINRKTLKEKGHGENKYQEETHYLENLELESITDFGDQKQESLKIKNDIDEDKEDNMKYQKSEDAFDDEDLQISSRK